MALTIAAPQGGFALAGRTPALVAVNSVNPPCGLPVSWSGLGRGAAGAATPPLPWTQARFAVSGTFGSYGGLQIQGSPDGVNWTPLAAVNDPAVPGSALYKDGGLAITALPNGVLVLGVTMDTGFPYLRPVVQGGDGTTSLNVTGNVSTTGAV
jgi:hypothetical protein